VIVIAALSTPEIRDALQATLNDLIP
jgi:hypothetical protein